MAIERRTARHHVIEEPRGTGRRLAGEGGQALVPKATTPPADPPTGDPAPGTPAVTGTPAAGDPAPAPAPPAAAPPAPAAGEPPAPGDAGPDLGALQHELDQARKEAARHRAELKRLQDAEKAREDAEKSELQKAQERTAELERSNADAERRLQETTLRAAAQTEAHRLGFLRPDRAWREIELSDVEYEDGNPTNLRKLLESEMKARPELKATAAPPPDAGQGDRGAATLTIEQIKRMKPEEINARYEEVERVLAGQAGR